MGDDVRADARRLLQGITPGPWRTEWNSDEQGGVPVYAESEPLAQCPDCCTTAEFEPADAEFIAAAPELVDRILAELDRVTTENERLVHPRPDEEHPIEIRHGWLVQAGQEPNFIPGYGYEPDTDAAPLMQLSDLPGWPGAELDAALATIQQVRDALTSIDNGVPEGAALNEIARAVGAS